MSRPRHAVARHSRPDGRVVLHGPRAKSLPSSGYLPGTDRHRSGKKTILVVDMLDFFCRYGDLASVCVLHTLYDLRVRGYEVVAPHDLVETYDALGHGAGGINGFDVAHIRDMLHATVT